jgi:hypothetical protein
MENGLQTLNGQQKLAEWATRIAECRNSGQSVLSWCKENGVCTQTYYKWQRRLFEMAKKQQEPQFAEISPPIVENRTDNISITVQVAGVEAKIHAGADIATVEAVLRILKLC